MTIDEKREAIENAKSIEELRALEESFKAEDEKVEEPKEAPQVNEEPKEEPKAEPKADEAKEVDERSLLRSSIEVRALNLSKMEDNKMEEKKEERRLSSEEVRATKEYRNAWAKKLMGLELDEVEERALGDAVGTTATTYVASAANTQGINNVGLFIPTSVVLALMERAEQDSPIFRDIRKLGVNGNVDVPYLDEADDAKWYAELTDTDNEGQKFAKVSLNGEELAKDIVLTWKADQMSVDGFVDFIVDELYEKMFKAKVKAVIYGTGSGEPTGLTNGLTAVTTGATPIDTIANTKAALSADAKIGAKIYISEAVADLIRFYKDGNNNYPYLVALPNAFEVDPYLANNDIVVGNMRKYIWNEQEPMRIDRDISVKGRKAIYGAYQVCDGAPKAGAFAYGQFTPSI